MRTAVRALALLALLAIAAAPCRGEERGAPGGEREAPGPESAERTFGDLTVRLSSLRPFQGDPVLVEVTSAVSLDRASFTWKGETYPMGRTGEGVFAGLLGVDLLDSPGTAALSVEASGGGRPRRIDLELEIRERSFPVQELTLPGSMTSFDDATLERIEREAKALAERFSGTPSPPRWTLPFHPPVDGSGLSGFGARRIINGEPRSPHAGADVSLPAGTPVAAIADGVVAFAGEQFFGGNSVVLDHGAGVFSVYYHLQGIEVSPGRTVARGERIGAVGSSGRATAPHLHFGVRAAGGRVDPALLLAIPAR